MSEKSVSNQDDIQLAVISETNQNNKHEQKNEKKQEKNLEKKQDVKKPFHSFLGEPVGCRNRCEVYFKGHDSLQTKHYYSFLDFQRMPELKNEAVKVLLELVELVEQNKNELKFFLQSYDVISEGFIFTLLDDAPVDANGNGDFDQKELDLATEKKIAACKGRRHKLLQSLQPSGVNKRAIKLLPEEKREKYNDANTEVEDKNALVLEARKLQVLKANVNALSEVDRKAYDELKKDKNKNNGKKKQALLNRTKDKVYKRFEPIRNKAPSEQNMEAWVHLCKFLNEIPEQQIKLLFSDNTKEYNAVQDVAVMLKDLRGVEVLPAPSGFLNKADNYFAMRLFEPHSLNEEDVDVKQDESGSSAQNSVAQEEKDIGKLTEELEHKRRVVKALELKKRAIEDGKITKLKNLREKRMREEFTPNNKMPDHNSDKQSQSTFAKCCTYLSKKSPMEKDKSKNKFSACFLYSLLIAQFLCAVVCPMVIWYRWDYEVSVLMDYSPGQIALQTLDAGALVSEKIFTKAARMMSIDNVAMEHDNIFLLNYTLPEDNTTAQTSNDIFFTEQMHASEGFFRSIKLGFENGSYFRAVCDDLPECNDVHIEDESKRYNSTADGSRDFATAINMPSEDFRNAAWFTSTAEFYFGTVFKQDSEALVTMSIPAAFDDHLGAAIALELRLSSVSGDWLEVLSGLPGEVFALSSTGEVLLSTDVGIWDDSDWDFQGVTCPNLLIQDGTQKIIDNGGFQNFTGHDAQSVLWNEVTDKVFLMNDPVAGKLIGVKPVYINLVGEEEINGDGIDVIVVYVVNKEDLFVDISTLQTTSSIIIGASAVICTLLLVLEYAKIRNDGSAEDGCCHRLSDKLNGKHYEEEGACCHAMLWPIIYKPHVVAMVLLVLIFFCVAYVNVTWIGGVEDSIALHKTYYLRSAKENAINFRYLQEDFPAVQSFYKQSLTQQTFNSSSALDLRNEASRLNGVARALLLMPTEFRPFSLFVAYPNSSGNFVRAILSEDASKYSPQVRHVDENPAQSCLVTYHPDVSSVDYLDCAFDPTMEPWYEATQSYADWSGLTSYTSMHALGLGVLGTTGTIPIFDENDEYIALLGMQFRTVPVSDFLGHWSDLINGTNVMFVQDNGWVIADGDQDGDNFWGGEDGSVVPRIALDLENEDLSLAATYLWAKGEIEFPDEWNEAYPLAYIGDDGEDTFPRALDQPLMFSYRIHGPNSDGENSWILFLLIDALAFFEKDYERTRNIINIVISGVLAILLYTSNQVIAKITNGKEEEEDADEKTTMDLMISLYKSVDFQKVMGELWKEQSAIGSRLPIRVTTVSGYGLDLAQGILKSQENQRSALTKVRAIQSGGFGYALFRLYENDWYQLLVQSVVFFHIVVGFVDHPNLATLQEMGVDWTSTVAEGACLIVEWSHVIVNGLVFYKVGRRHESEAKAYTPDWNKIVFTDLAILVLVSALTFQWVTTVAFRWKFEYVLPCRPILLLFIHPRILDGMIVFFTTFYMARDALIFAVILLTIMAITGMMLLREIVNPGAPDSSYDEIFSAWTTTFVYALTTENFSDCVTPAWDESGALGFYFFVVTLVGQFLMSSVFINKFGDGFTDIEAQKLVKQEKAARVGSLVAFMLIDSDRSVALGEEELFDLYKHLVKDEYFKPSDAELKVIISGRLLAAQRSIEQGIGLNWLDEEGDFTVDWYQTHIALEVYQLAHGLGSDDSAQNRDESINKMIQSKGYLTLRTCLLGGTIWWLCFYGAFNNFLTLDVLYYVLLWVLNLELLLRIKVIHPIKYWYWDDFVEKGILKQFRHRLDAISQLVATLGSTAAIVLGGGFQGAYANWYRCLVAFPVFRLIGLHKETLRIVWCLVLSMPMVTNMAGLVLVMMFLFSWYGVLFFGGQLSFLDYTDEGVGGSCDELTECLFVHFQLMVGSGWHGIMYGAKRRVGWSAVYYFLVYMIFFNVLLTELLIGIIGTYYDVAIEHPNPTADVLRLHRLQTEIETKRQIEEEDDNDD